MMRKINHTVVANQEAFEYLNGEAKEELKPFWEEAVETYETQYLRYGYTKEEWEEEEFFWNQLREYEKKYFEGKRWDDIDPIIKDVWSDLYKDVNGFRPHRIPFGCIA